MAEKIVLAELDIDVKSFIKSTTDLKDAISRVKAEQDFLKASGQTVSDAFIENEAVLKSLSKVYASNIKVISESSQATIQEANGIDLLNVALNTEAASIAEARQQNQLLNKLRNETNVSTAEGRAQLEQLNTKLDSNNAFIKENADQYLQQKINIGNYSGALNTLSPELGGIVTQLQSFTTGLLAQKEALLASTVVTGGTTGALKAFRIALISTGVGAIVVVLGSLISFLTKTQQGIDLVTSVTRPLQAIFESFIGVAQNLGKSLFEAFSNPKKVLTDISDFIQNNFINRAKAVLVIFDAIKNRDFKGLVDGIAQGVTGVENLSGKIANGAKETAKFLADAAKKGADLDVLEKSLSKTRTENILLIGKATEEVKAQNRIAEDQTKTLAEREKATALSIVAGKEITRLKNEELDIEIAILKNKQSRNGTLREETQELNELTKKKNENNAAELELTTTQTNKLNSIRKEQATAAKAESDKRIESAIKESQDLVNLFIAQQGFKIKSLDDTFIFEQDLTAKRLSLLKQEFDAGKKSKTEYEAEKLNIENSFLQKSGELVVEQARINLETEINNIPNIIQKEKFISEAILAQEKERIAQIEQLRLDFALLQFEKGLISEEQYQQQITDVQLAAQTKRDEAELLRQTTIAEANKIDLENERILNEQAINDEFIIQANRLEELRKLEVEAAEKTGADVDKINKKFARFQADLDLKRQINQVDSYRNALQGIGQLLSAFGVENKNINISLALVDTFLSAQKAYLSQLSIPSPDAPVRAFIAAAKATAFGLINVAKIQGVKFEQGGTMEVQGNRHSQGGTKFVGSDGTQFEAERGELIGVMNRSASDRFMSFNNAFGKRGTVGTSYAQNGGIIARGINGATNDIEQLANLTADLMAKMPAPIVTVEDINRVRNAVMVIEDGASF